MHVATLIAGSFTIVSTLGRSAPALEHLVHKYGFNHRCRRVRTAEVPVLALEEPGSGALTRLREEIARAVAEDRCEAIVLGCAGMADLNAALADRIRSAGHRRRRGGGKAGRGRGRAWSDHKQVGRLCAAIAEAVFWRDGAIRAAAVAFADRRRRPRQIKPSVLSARTVWPAQPVLDIRAKAVNRRSAMVWFEAPGWARRPSCLRAERRSNELSPALENQPTE